MDKYNIIPNFEEILNKLTKEELALFSAMLSNYCDKRFLEEELKLKQN